MLARLSVRNVVLIERLDLEFGPGLCALTGETGAGKSILLDALGLALGKRADVGLLRPGGDRATVTAAFELEAAHPAHRWLDDHGIDGDEIVVLRRTLGGDGRSRGFVNDQPVTVAAMAELAGLLVEIFGQHDRLGLMDSSTHRGALDRFARTEPEMEACRAAHRDWRDASARLTEAETAAADDAERRDELAAFLAEIDALAPEPGEEAVLSDERDFLMASEKIAEALNTASEVLAGSTPADQALRTARFRRPRHAPSAAGKLDDLAAALEAEEALAMLDATGHGLVVEPNRLEVVEERLFGLRAIARKHAVEVDALGDLRAGFAARLDAITAGDQALEDLRAAVTAAREAFVARARALSKARSTAAASLDKKVNRELGPLKLGAAKFATRLDALDEDQWGPDGAERVAFEVATNPGHPPGDLREIASGGELSRFMLALSVVLSNSHGIDTMVFDEIDAGIGGATAHAVGERLARLAARSQVLVVTHQPQVAAQAGVHFKVAKATKRAATQTLVETLDGDERLEEVARMLAGATVTDQARAAASSLLDGAEKASKTA